MTLKSFKTLVANLPEDFNDFEVVYTRFNSIGQGKWRKESRPVGMLLFDQDSSEILLIDEIAANNLSDVELDSM